MSDFAVAASIRAIDKFSATFHGIGDALGKFGSKGEQAIDRVNRKASLFKSILGGVVAGNLITMGIQKVGQGLRSMVESIPKFAERVEQIGRSSQMLGLSADAFQRLSYAAKMTDTPTEALEVAMKKLNMAIGQGARGMGPLIAQMSKLSPQLAMQLRTTHNADDAFMAVADAVSKTTNAQARAAIVVAAFGKSGQEMLPMLLKGRAGLMELRKAAVDVIPESVIATGEKFSEGWKTLKANVQSVKDRVLGFAVTLAEKYLPPIMKWLEANKEIIATKIERFIDRMANALENARPVLLFLWNAASWLIKNWPLLLVVYGAWTAAQLALDAAMLASGIPEIVIGITAMITAVIMVIKYWHEITSALQAAWNWFNKLFANPWIANALYFLAAPIWLVMTAVRTLVDLLSGKGWKSFENFIPPWLRGATNKLGLTAAGDTSGTWGGGEKAPNKGMTPFQFINQVNVDNTRAPGVSSTVRASPVITGNPGYQYSGAQ